MIIAPEYVRDAHFRIIHGNGEVVEGKEALAVQFRQRDVAEKNGVERDLSAHEILEREMFLGHSQANDRSFFARGALPSFLRC
ncbi:MAG: hypothetical protein A2682_01130 [Candidatus Terrybacteria bacterium RIFCSPHIGHO2_01_FULL_58_15]|uniref:Uncharacterized protein n=1 Tax=Terrybacteria sp. (strain RIFCSPHIGHO2_01_FULL_58_15) TaxID=1802363 RepID=A0A1G2PNP8_TERXR|nr:MAG: hypothetical protein A2682_01130 [Candidatus Terrybacteria bacterium RIFCSPHIGHO2_01_FULL_58_15]